MEAFVVLLPLFGALLVMPASRLAGVRFSQRMATWIMGLAAIFSWILFFDVAPVFGSEGHPRTILLFNWMTSGAFSADWAVRLDTLSVVMLVVVNSVSFLVHLYSTGYMQEYGEQPRFFAYLSLFTFAMLTLVTADNLLQLFFGWEGVGLASYLLIGFWYRKKSANDAAIKAFIVNRVGDFGFILGIMCVFFVFGSLRFDTIIDAVATNAVITLPGMETGAPVRALSVTFLGVSFHALTVIGLLLFVGAMGKSAQFFLHTWLPDAMEGPTPVSALIHAATMVTAGVFLVCRFSVIYEYAPQASTVITFVGALTAFFAATVGLLQDDIKKIIAYSTCSQLGYMFFAAGVGAYDAAMFHLFTHAFFKALLFLGAGSVIIGMHHEQNIKKMGGVKDFMPLTHLLMVCGTLAITGVGIPFLYLAGAPLGFAGFVSKDVIIVSAYEAAVAGRPLASLALVAGIVAAAFTAFYSWRLVFLVFRGSYRMKPEVRKNPHPVPDAMLVPLVPLAVGAIAAGMVFYNDFAGKGSSRFWGDALYLDVPAGGISYTDDHDGASVRDLSAGADTRAAPGHGGGVAVRDESAAGYGDAVHSHEGSSPPSKGDEDHHYHGPEDHHHEPAWVYIAPFAAMALGFFAAFAHYLRKDPLRPGLLRPGGILYGFLKNAWYFDRIYDFLFVRPVFFIGRFFWKTGDEATIDGAGPDGIASSVARGARRLVKLQSGYVYHYAFVMLAGIAVFLSYTLLGTGG